jgi:hydroxymethylpyrimidine/phosphomethylpyrimidine kinase
MTIAGSDSGAGAGLQADLKTFAALGVFGTSVVTAITAQNTAEVLAVEAVDPELVGLQMTAVLDDLPVAAVKTGMLGTAANVAVVASRAAAGELPNLVVDPVLVASTGRRLLDRGGLSAYVELLLPHAHVLTPNTREAALLSGSSVDDLEAMITAGRVLCDRGARFVVVTGGHLHGDEAPDVVVGAGEVLVLDAARVASGNDHGTGCTLSAAIAALLARDVPVLDAIEQAKAFVTSALQGAASWHLGKGHGPLDHFRWNLEATSDTDNASDIHGIGTGGRDG